MSFKIFLITLLTFATTTQFARAADQCAEQFSDSSDELTPQQAAQITSAIDKVDNVIDAERTRREQAAQAENDALLKARPPEMDPSIPFDKRMAFVHNKLNAPGNLTPIGDLIDGFVIHQAITVHPEILLRYFPNSELLKVVDFYFADYNSLLTTGHDNLSLMDRFTHGGNGWKYYNEFGFVMREIQRRADNPASAADQADLDQTVQAIVSYLFKTYPNTVIASSDNSLITVKGLNLESMGAILFDNLKDVSPDVAQLEAVQFLSDLRGKVSDADLYLESTRLIQNEVIHDENEAAVMTALAQSKVIDLNRVFQGQFSYKFKPMTVNGVGDYYTQIIAIVQADTTSPDHADVLARKQATQAALKRIGIIK